MEDKIIDEYYISKAKEIIIRFIDDTECTISDIRALDLDLNSDDINIIYPHVQMAYNHRTRFPETDSIISA